MVILEYLFNVEKGEMTISRLMQTSGDFGRNISDDCLHTKARKTRQKTRKNLNGLPSTIRTCDLRLRRPLLYPAELQAHTVYPAR